VNQSPWYFTLAMKSRTLCTFRRRQLEYKHRDVWLPAATLSPSWG